MENELFMNSMLPTWHSPSPVHFSSSLVDMTAAADNNPLAKNDNSLLRELIGKLSSFGTGSFNGRPITRFCPKLNDLETEDQAHPSSSQSQENQILEGVDLRKRKSALRLIKVEEDSNSKKKAKQIEDSRVVVVEDCIHVKARRGHATDSHSLAERMRREKIGERMKFLQNLVPGCSRVNGKAVMLDEIINYVQSLQRQVQFLSMKLASMNSVGNEDSNGNFNVETLVQNHNILPLNFFNGSTINRALHAPQFPPMASDRFNHHVLPLNQDVKVQYNGLFGDELRNIVNTGYNTQMKIEL